MRCTNVRSAATSGVSKSDLRLDWCSHEAAKWAVEHWHYSHAMPAGKLCRIGVWEKCEFVGCIMFGRGSGGNIGKPFGLGQDECVELVRVALLSGHFSQVSRMVAIALRLLQTQSPGLRLVVSFADPEQGHHGGIYQAGGWIYCGDTRPDRQVKMNGEWRHTRTCRSRYGNGAETQFRAAGLYRATLGKHRYLMPLDDEMRRQIEPLRKPYPKRAPDRGTSVPTDAGGASPTCTLQNSTGNVATLEATGEAFPVVNTL